MFKAMTLYRPSIIYLKIEVNANIYFKYIHTTWSFASQNTLLTNNQIIIAILAI
jgi:hypothetical protein